jgi:hypothetical protein
MKLRIFAQSAYRSALERRVLMTLVFVCAVGAVIPLQYMYKRVRA